MLNREMIMEELENRGYEVMAQNTVKNGVELQGICIGVGNIRPLVYVNSFIEEAEECDLTLKEVVDKIESVLDVETPDINIEELGSHDFILEHIEIGVQKKSEENLLKRESGFEDIESYLFVNFEGGSYKLYRHHIKTFGLSEEELWERAKENSRKTTVIKSLYSVMNEMVGVDFEEEEVEPMYVISNNSRFRGAASVLNRDLVEEFANKLGVKGFAILPSSVHEMLLIPFREESEIDMRMLNEMVWQVNHTQVEPEERLTDRAYMYQF